METKKKNPARSDTGPGPVLFEYRISVRGLVEFVLREGDIVPGARGDSMQAMLEGKRIHRMIQKRQGDGYRAEVPLSHTVEMDGYTLVVEGRADGIADRDNAPGEPTQLDISTLLGGDAGNAAAEDTVIWEKVPVIDEIKGTYRDIDKLSDADPLHLAQAKCYAFFYAFDNGLDAVRVRMTYCSLETGDIRYFRYRYRTAELASFFSRLIEGYRRFADDLHERKGKKTASAGELQFPYEYRKGQKKLAGYVYRTIERGRRLFLEAPTGAGKTLAVIFPALKAVGEGHAGRIFYLTAKTIARTAPEQAYDILRERGLIFRTVTLTAKEKICVLEKPECDPHICPRAKGHYDRVNDALYDLLQGEDSITREVVMEVAAAHKVCPFELSLDLALFADGVICDLNYAFDPFVYLKRFFAESSRGDAVFLVDEAHNLLDRGREMYSADMTLEELGEAETQILRSAKGTDEEKPLRKAFKNAFLALEDAVSSAPPDRPAIVQDIEELLVSFDKLSQVMSSLLGEVNRNSTDEELSFYFRLFRFLDTAGHLDGNYYIQAERYARRQGRIKLFCADPSGRLREAMDRAVASVLFSATMLPIRYYKSMLGGTDEDYEAYAETSFDLPGQMGLFIGTDVTTRYSMRGDAQYAGMARYISEALRARPGKYLAFFPSWKVLYSVRAAMTDELFDKTKTEIVMQQENMTEEGREEFLSHFGEGSDASFDDMIDMDVEVDEDFSVLGMCVLGGIFGEGINLCGDRLIGVIIAGTGLPQVSDERELMRGWFGERGGDGFAHAYLYPGMNRVLQAAGRLIRTENDRGILMLLDDRFTDPSYSCLFPKEWKNIKTVTTDTVKNALEAFWKRIDTNSIKTHASRNID